MDQYPRKKQKSCIKGNFYKGKGIRGDVSSQLLKCITGTSVKLETESSEKNLALVGNVLKCLISVEFNKSIRKKENIPVEKSIKR